MLLVLSYHRTYGLPITISRSNNNYGPYQYKEKLIPLVISKALKNERIPIYGDGKQIRNWIYVEDCCKAIDSIVRKGKDGSIYNINTKDNISNIDIVKTILDILHKPYSLIEHVSDRLGHDRRYLMDSSRIEKELGFIPTVSFDEGIKETVG
jgi:dTDP-glucose 4,6-dehydratase